MKYKLVAILIVICCACGFAQNKKGRNASSVKREQAEVKKQISQTKSNLENNKKRTRNQLNQLNSLNSVIEHTNANINEIKSKISKLTFQEKQLNDSINSITEEVSTLKKECKKTLADDRKRRKNMSELSLVFSSKDFMQAMKRSVYIRQLNKMAADKQKRLIERQNTLNTNKAALVELKKQQTELAANLTHEHDVLKEKQSQTQKLINQLKSEANTLTSVLNDQQKRAKALDAELNRIIEEEARRAEAERKAQEARKAEEARKAAEAKRAEEARIAKEKKKAEDAQKKEDEQKKQKGKKDKNNKADSNKKEEPTKADSPSKTTTTTEPPVLRSVASDGNMNPSGTFQSNKGRLLFPVSGKYNIVSTFGINTHKNLPGVKTENSGIDIQVASGSNARAVFDGVVSSIFYLDGYQNIIMVRHGEYLSVYANIGRLSVKKGDKVKTGQQLGQIYSDPSDNNRTVLHFEVRRETQKLNPLEWVKR